MQEHFSASELISLIYYRLLQLTVLAFLDLVERLAVNA